MDNDERRMASSFPESSQGRTINYPCQDACHIDVFKVDLSASQLSSNWRGTFLSSKRSQLEIALRRAKEVKSRTNPGEFAGFVTSVGSFVTAISEFEDFIVFGIADDRTSHIAETRAALHSMNDLLRTDIRDNLFQSSQDIYHCYFHWRKSVIDNIKHAVSETAKATGDFFQLLNYLNGIILYLNDDDRLKWDGAVALLEKVIRLLQESQQTMAFYSSYVTNEDPQSDQRVLNEEKFQTCLPRHVFARMNTTRTCVTTAKLQESINKETLSAAEELSTDVTSLSNFLRSRTSGDEIIDANLSLPVTDVLQVEYADNKTAIRVTLPTHLSMALEKENEYWNEVGKYLNCLTSYEHLLTDMVDFLESIENLSIKLKVNREVDRFLGHAAAVRSWLEVRMSQYARNETTKEQFAKDFSLHVDDFMATSETVSKETQQFVIGPLQDHIREAQVEVESLYVKGLEVFRELVSSINSPALRKKPRSMIIWKGPLPDLGSSQVYIYAHLFYSKCVIFSVYYVRVSCTVSKYDSIFNYKTAQHILMA